MRRRPTPSFALAIALGGLAVLSTCAGSTASTHHGVAARTYTAVFVGDHGYRYRVTVKLRLPPVVPRLAGPPDMEYIIADPQTFIVTVANLTQGRRSPVFAHTATPMAGVISAWWRLPRALRESAAVEGQKFAGNYADLSAVLSRKANEQDARHDVELEPGGTVTLKSEQIVDFGGGYFLPGGVGTWLVPRPDVRLARDREPHPGLHDSCRFESQQVHGPRGSRQRLRAAFAGVERERSPDPPPRGCRRPLAQLRPPPHPQSLSLKHTRRSGTRSNK